MNSIRTKLLIYLLTGLFIGTLLATLGVYWQAKEESSEFFDYQLKQLGDTFVATKEITSDKLSDHDQIIEAEDDFALIVWGMNNERLLTRGIHISPNHPAAVGLTTIIIGEEKWHSYVVSKSIGLVQFLQPHSVRDDLATTAAFRTIIPLLLLFPFFGIFIGLTVKQQLSPIMAIKKSLESRDEYSLHPLSADAMPSELIPLIHTLNILFEKLEAALKSQREFVADAAHELRTPLAALKLQLDLAIQAKDDVQRSRALTNLDSGIDRASRLVSQLLTLARHESRFESIDFKEFEPSHLLKNILVHFAAVAEAKQIDMGAERLENISILANENEIEIAFSNLLDNALHYTPQGGTVDIDLYTDQNEIIVRVIDSGIGIKEADKKRILDRFYRVDPNAGLGSGLGLSIVQKICEANHAKLTISDNHPVGTIFSIIFPTKNDLL